MTWQTPRGDRVPAGPEAAVFREALMIITDWVEGDMDQDQAFHEFGFPVFDSVAARGNLALLADVVHALLVETEACPKLTAVSEATAGAIFVALDESLEHEIDNEFDLPDRFFFRKLILEAIAVVDPDLETPHADDCDWDDWEFLIDLFRDRILWDRDFEAEPTFGDADPLTGEDVKDNTGIDNDYFQTVAPDPSDEELESIRRRLKLLRS
jgi:hypothetical protein